MPVRQGLIPAAGSGSRLGPFTNAIPKELLPVGEKAVIEHVVEAMHLAGVTDIVIVVSLHKHGRSDYLGSGKRFSVDFTYVQETLIQAANKNLTLVQVPVEFRKRDEKSRLIASLFGYASSAGKTIAQSYDEDAEDARGGDPVQAEEKTVTATTTNLEPTLLRGMIWP